MPSGDALLSRLVVVFEPSIDPAVERSITRNVSKKLTLSGAAAEQHHDKILTIFRQRPVSTIQSPETASEEIRSYSKIKSRSTAVAGLHIWRGMRAARGPIDRVPMKS